MLSHAGPPKLATRVSSAKSEQTRRLRHVHALVHARGEQVCFAFSRVCDAFGFHDGNYSL